MEQPDQQTTRRTSTSAWGRVGRWLRCAVKWSSAGIAVLLLAVVVYAAFRFLPDRAVTYDTMEDHFKYGSTGGDRLTGIPYLDLAGHAVGMRRHFASRGRRTACTRLSRSRGDLRERRGWPGKAARALARGIQGSRFHVRA